MSNNELLERLEISNKWTADAILKLKELIENEHKFTEAAMQKLHSEILTKIQLNISEMEILALEVEGWYHE